VRSPDLTGDNWDLAKITTWACARKAKSWGAGTHMNSLLPILIFLAGVVVILILEIRFKTHPVTEAIRPWQSGLGALLGFVSLALSAP
jgi:hypothetical protein